MKLQTFSLRHVSRLDTRDPVIGDSTLTWSDDNCIAVGTNKNTLLFDLNPLQEVKCLDMLFKSQSIPSSEELPHITGVKHLLDDYDKLRSMTSRDAAHPSYDMYRINLRPEITNDAADVPGIKALCFSPSCCAPGGGSVLAILTAGHCLDLYIKSSDGTSIQWTRVIGLSEVIVTTLAKHHGYYPDIDLPCVKSSAKAMWEKHHAARISFVTWGDLVDLSDGKIVFLVTCSISNYLLVWKLKVPVCSSNDATIISYTKTFDGEIKSITVLKSSSNSGSVDISIGAVDGRLICFHFDKDGTLVRKREIWTEKDELQVSCINWTACPLNEGYANLLAGKSYMILHAKMTSDLQILSCFVLAETHAFPVVSLFSSARNTWLSASCDGVIAKLWIERRESSCGDQESNEMKSEILVGADAEQSLFRETIHHLVASPNLAFLAILKSKPKVSRSVMAENLSTLEIRTLKNGMESFEDLLFKDRPDPGPRMDLLESVRLHLLHNKFSDDATANTLLGACIEQYIFSEGTSLPSKWCLMKICAGHNPKCAEALLALEKKIAAKQMLKVLKYWMDGDLSSYSGCLPARNLVKWLGENIEMLGLEDVNFLNKLKNCQKYARSLVEVCVVTGESLLVSEDGRRAVSEKSGIHWPRCCLTFCAIQGFEYRRCEVCDSRAVCDMGLSELLHHHSIYCGLPML